MLRAVIKVWVGGRRFVPVVPVQDRFGDLHMQYLFKS